MIPPRSILRIRAVLRDIFKPLWDGVSGRLVVALLKTTRHFDPQKTSEFFAGIMRKIGPYLPENRIGHANLSQPFRKIARRDRCHSQRGLGHLGRVGAEFAHLDHIWDYEPSHPQDSHIELTQDTIDKFAVLREDGKGALVFASHLANWELPALAGPAHGLDCAILFRRPNVAAVDRAVQDIRRVNMGKMIATTPDAPYKLAEALNNGVHVGMLVDQYFHRGVDVTFFGRTTKANPLLARLLRQVDVPVYGVRVVRLPGHRFRAELSDEVKPVRDAQGKIDVQGTMQAVTSVIEGWVREHPEQWLWLHRRWR